MSLRLPVGRVTVLLGPALARHRVMNALDSSGGRCASDHSVDVCRLIADRHEGVASRLVALDEVPRAGASIVLVDRFTDGLAAPERRAVLSRLRDIVEGRAVLVHDTDPVAALAVADDALRIERSGRLVFESVGELDYLAS